MDVLLVRSENSTSERFRLKIAKKICEITVAVIGGRIMSKLNEAVLDESAI